MTKEFEELGDLGVDVPVTDTTRIAKRSTPAERAARPRATLRVERCPDARQVDAVFALRTDDVRIGREEALNTFAFNDQDVSRQHLALLWRVDGYVLSDLSTTNGTRVNAEPVKTERALRSDDLILIGATMLRYKRGP